MKLKKQLAFSALVRDDVGANSFQFSVFSFQFSFLNH